MYVAVFKPKDLDEVNSWYAARGKPLVPRDLISDVGYWVPGVAAGWLYLTNAPSLAFLDNYIANPSASKDDRAEALEAITRNLIEDARDLGVTRILALSRAPTLIDLAQRLGLAVYSKECYLLGMEI